MQTAVLENIDTSILPGRAIRKVIGKNSFFSSTEMTFGRTIFSSKYGKMTPHCHAAEILYIINVKHGRFRYGNTKECEHVIDLVSDQVLYIAPGEWHAFEFDSDKDYANVLFFYATTENLRPEDCK